VAAGALPFACPLLQPEYREIPARDHGGRSCVVLLSGDGGWAAIDRHLTQRFADAGLPTLFWNMPLYLFTPRSPEEVARDLERNVNRFSQASGCAQVAVIGYSRGAVLLPAAVRRIPPPSRSHIRLVALLSPERTATFDFRLQDFLYEKPRGPPVLPDVRGLGMTPVLCVYGQDERSTSLCPQLPPTGGAVVVSLPGGHHFDGNYQHVANVILETLADQLR